MSEPKPISPDRLRPFTPEVLELARQYYALPGNGAGGNLHIILDDGNIDNDHIQSCRDQCIESGDDLGLTLCDLLGKMSKTQRRKIYRSL